MNSDGHFPIGTCFGVYELTGVIGEGGMGTVYAAVHQTLGKRVAVKTLRTQLASDPDLRARFVREGKAAAAVRHPNVVDVDDVGIAGDIPYLVMELLEGESLGARIARVSRLSIPELLDVILPVLLALAEAHRAGIVHRDLKPDNIFIASDYHGVSVPKLLDFGISKLRERHSLGLTHERMMLGTPHYMPPEQAASARDVDARSDLYSMGVILYHGVSGRVPFAGTTLSQVIGQILHAEPVPLCELTANLPPQFDAIVLRCLAKDPAHRYQDALSLARELLPFASMRMQLTYGPVLAPGAATERAAGSDTSADVGVGREEPGTAAEAMAQAQDRKASGARTRMYWRMAWLVPLLLALGLAARFAYGSKGSGATRDPGTDVVRDATRTPLTTREVVGTSVPASGAAPTTADEQVRGTLPAGSGKRLPDTNEVEGSAEQPSHERGAGSRKPTKLGPEPDSAAHKRPAKAAHGTPSGSAHSAAHTHDAPGAADAADKRSGADDDAIWGDRR